MSDSHHSVGLMVARVVLGFAFCAMFAPSSTLALETPVSAGPPLNSASPTLTGTPAVGQSLSCSRGGWTDEPTSYVYAWLRDGSPIAGQSASAYTVQAADQGHAISCEVSAGKLGGEYAISGLPSGAYRVAFSMGEQSNNFLTQYFNGRSSLGEAETVAVTAGSAASNIDAALQTGGQITGTVTGAGGGALADVEVCAYLTVSEFPRCGATDSAGQYTLAGLASGSYSVEFRPGFSEGNYIGQYFNGRSASGEADPVSVTAGSTTSNINAALGPGGQITGVVTAAGGGPLRGIEVCTEDEHTFNGRYGACAFTNATGEYTISGLETGKYKVRFFTEGEGGNYLPQYYANAGSSASALQVTVAAGRTTPTINAEMQPGGQISGVVRAAGGGPLAGIEVCANPVVGEEGFDSCARTNGTGEYTISGLASGEYKVSFAAAAEGSNYTSQFYNGRSAYSEAEPVLVAAGHATSAINAEMQAGGQISGKVTDASTHAPVANVQACAGEIGVEGGSYCATTNSAGEYTISALTTGSYRVNFLPAGSENGNYLDQFYDGKAAEGESNPVPVRIGEVTPAIDAQLQAGAQIAGRVTAASGGAALGGIQVCAEDMHGETIGTCATTNVAVSSVASRSNALAVPVLQAPLLRPTPSALLTQTKAPVFDAKTGDLDFFFTVSSAGTLSWNLRFKNADVGFADALGIAPLSDATPSVSVAGPASAALLAQAGKKRKSCKRGYLRYRRRCVRALVLFSAGSQRVPVGTVEVKVHAGSNAIRALKAGHTLHVSGPFTFQPAQGGAAITHVESTVVRPPRKRAVSHHEKHSR